MSLNINDNKQGFVLEPNFLELTGTGFNLVFSSPTPTESPTFTLKCDLQWHSPMSLTPQNIMHCDSQHTHFWHGKKELLITIHHHSQDPDLEYDWHLLADPGNYFQSILRPVQNSVFPTFLTVQSLKRKFFSDFRFQFHFLFVCL